MFVSNKRLGGMSLGTSVATAFATASGTQMIAGTAVGRSRTRPAGCLRDQAPNGCGTLRRIDYPMEQQAAA